MSGIEIVGLVAGVIGILDVALKAYTNIHNIAGLPKAFQEVAKRVPLVLQILKTIETQCANTSAPEEYITQITPVIQDCKENAEKLRLILQKLDAKDATWKPDRYLAIIKSWGKKGRVEELMKRILEDVELLAADKTMKAATADQLQGLKDALWGLSMIEPSAPDRLFEKHDEISISHGGTGTQHNVLGDNNTSHTGSGNIFGDLRGATLNFGPSPLSLRQMAQVQSHLAKQNQVTATEQAQSQTNSANPVLSEKEEKVHQLFRLASYEWYKDRVDERVPDTCMWFLQHKGFQKWLQQDTGPLLVSADPGCGKSVLAKYLIDDGLPQSATVCYFFFKDQDQNTIQQALCALLHQLFSKKKCLIEHAVRQFQRDGKSLINLTESLWNILRNAICDPQAGPIILVLDALDECAESEFTELMRNIQAQFRSHWIRNTKLKYLLTSRPYEQIVSRFRGLQNRQNRLPKIHIPGEEESETISMEVNRVVTYRINELSDRKQLPPQIQNHLRKKLQETTHRTYLWVYFVFDYLNNTDFRRTIRGVESTIATLPTSVNQAYEQILNKSSDKERYIVRKALSIILAASRPLRLSEMNIALQIDYTVQSLNDLDLEDEENFKSRFRSLCGLFISIYHDKIYFLHQTAREFLLAGLAPPTHIPAGRHWQHSITLRHAHAVLTEACVLYLNLLDSNDATRVVGAGWSSENSAFLDYSARTWIRHFREADVTDDEAIVPFALRICDVASKSYLAWFKIYWTAMGLKWVGEFTNLMVASFGGLPAVAKLLLEKGAEIEATDGGYRRTPLLWAGIQGHEGIARLLLENGADIEAKDKSSNTTLIYAAVNGYEGVVRLLLEHRADVSAKRQGTGQEPLSMAASFGYEAIVRLLLKNGANMEAKDTEHQWTPLTWAAKNEHEEVVTLLLQKGAKIEAKDKYHQALLLWAASKGNVATIEMLLSKGANIEVRDRYRQTPLFNAAGGGHEAAIELLLKNSADIEAKDSNDWTPLLWAIMEAQEASSKILIEMGSNIEAQDKNGQKPLAWAAKMGHKGIVELLLENGADIEAQDFDHSTPLRWAVSEGHEAVVKLLLQRGANLRIKDKTGVSLLAVAILRRHRATVKVLLDHGAILEKHGHWRARRSWLNTLEWFEELRKQYPAKMSDQSWLEEVRKQYPGKMSDQSWLEMDFHAHMEAGMSEGRWRLMVREKYRLGRVSACIHIYEHSDLSTICELVPH